MNLDELLNKEEEDILSEAKHTRSDEYPRYWHHFTPEEKEQYVKEGHKPKSGIWVYRHREAMGLDYHDKDKVVHHKSHDKNDYSKENLQIVTRSEHAIIDPNRKIYGDDEKCKIKGCGNSIYSHYLCYKHYMQKYRKGEFGNYDPKKNKSKKDRKEKGSKKDK